VTARPPAGDDGPGPRPQVAALFFPLLLLEGLNLHVASARFLASGAATRHRRLERWLSSATY